MMDSNVNNLHDVATNLLSSVLPTILWLFGFIVAIKVICHFHRIVRNETRSDKSNESHSTQKVIAKPEVPMQSMEQNTDDKIVISKGVIQFPKTVKIENSLT